ncbi:MAG TPA: leucine--tRNA ligase [candidate division Zixibacteria bacterium]
MKTYPSREIEAKWQKIWEENKLYKTPEFPKKKYYMLEMFAYPSGDIHIGHFRNYIIGDAVARQKMMQGYEVLHPFGWDAFGLPAEIAAIERNVHPREWTLSNINVSRSTLKRIGLSYDWDREVITCLPDYYRWTQWMFIQLYKNNLAYRAQSLVNWCPTCKTVLANEQVEQGRCWRCKSEVTKKELEQWFFRITAYADRLLSGLDKLDGWRPNVKIMQRNWIGKSQGVEIDFEIENSDKKISVFTTRPDTIYGVTFMAISPENQLLKELKIDSKHAKAVEEYIRKSIQKSDIERTALGEKDGVFTGVYAINPLSKEKIQLWVGDYVLATYGTGIVMGVPAHDQRDFEFAKKYKIPLKVVIQPEGANLLVDNMQGAYTEPGIMINSDIFNGTWSSDGIQKVNQYVVDRGLGRLKTNYKLRDWLISRQRYWGAPIPIIYCQKCGILPVLEKDLPVLLPEGEIDFIPKGRSPLADVPKFVNITCPKCKGVAKRDVDTMDTFVCSSWYFLRYGDAHNGKEPFSKEKAKFWLPVDKYIGGIEHACGHLLYFRFFTKFLFDIGWLKVDEPAIELFNHGMVLDSEGQVMSKSKGNVSSPVDLIDKYGVDVSRVAMYFSAPSEREVLWSEEGITGAKRFLNRVYALLERMKTNGVEFDCNSISDKEKEIYKHLHRTIKKVSEDIDRLQFNTAIASMMEFLNQFETLSGDAKIYGYCLTVLAQLLAPFTPHLSEEIWSGLGKNISIFKCKWPEYNKEAVKFEQITIPVQVNGKLRSTLVVPVDVGEEEVKIKAVQDEKVKPYLEGKRILKTIFVKNRLINLVVK